MNIQKSITVLCLVVVAFTFLTCKPKENEQEKTATSIVNTAHLDTLYEEIKLGDDSVGIIHIYANHPDYKFVGDADEGFTCADDVTRAAVFYLKQYQKTSSPEYLRKGRMLLKFVLAMQAPNGYYYNFIWPDRSINTNGITSEPIPGFWAWRPLWAFGEALQILDPSDALVPEIKQQRERLVSNILTEPSYRSTETDTSMGWAFPTWLPKGSGTDQASIVLIGLTRWLQQSDTNSMRKDSVIRFMEHFADGITAMQIEQPDSLYDGAFMSWENLWHAYANIQSYALLIAGQELKDPHMIAHAIYEIDHFYPRFIANDGLDNFWIRVDDEKMSMYDSKVFSQIAYGRSPMVLATMEAYKMTKDEKYLSLAKELTSWFTGTNPANTPMYDPATGRGYDGISGPDQINKNSGAESTIESLLTMQLMEQYLDNK